MVKLVCALAISLLAGAALGEDTAVGKDAPVADQATDNVETPTAAVKKAQEGEFEPPPGFQTKKQGKHVLYCKKDRTTGTRFVTEKCYDEAQMRDYLIALEEQKRNIDRIRSTCATAAVCASP
jgi:hypothetical protein